MSNYTSDFFVHVHVNNLNPSTRYYYHVGSISDPSKSIIFTDNKSVIKRSLLLQTKYRVDDLSSFITAPVPLSHGNYDQSDSIKFALVGDLGQTEDSLTTIHHIAQDDNINAILHAGDLSYADSDQQRWDQWFEMIEFLSKRMPWLVCPGNHEIETNGMTKDIFVPYQNRLCKF